jgi:hypothetical protein
MYPVPFPDPLALLVVAGLRIALKQEDLQAEPPGLVNREIGCSRRALSS